MADNCPDITHDTASRWMGLANSAKLRNLGDAKTLQEAYRRVGLLPEAVKEKKGIGTAPVDILANLFQRFDKGLCPVIDIAATIDPQDIPHERRVELLTKAQPMIEFVERVKAAEGV